MGDSGAATALKDSQRRVILVGNPNVGKSVIFGILTGRYVTVSNYPGTTVEITQGNATVNGRRSLILDTPGANSLIPMSEDERVTRDILMTDGDRVVLQVGDAKNLRRSMLLTVQLSEMGMPFVLALNMDDEARSRGVRIDAKALSEKLGVPVVATVATQRTGISQVTASLDKPGVSALRADYGEVIENAIAQVSEFVPANGIATRSVALMLLSGDESMKAWLRASVSDAQLAQIEDIRHTTQKSFTHPLSYVISRARLTAADAVVSEVMTTEPRTTSTVAEWIGRWSMHWLWGIPFLLAVLVSTYFLVGDFAAGTCVDFLQDTVFGAPGEGGWIVPPLERAITSVLGTTGVGGFLRDMLVGQYGVITMAVRYAVAIILPIVTFFFLVFGCLEDSGYMPRLAVMVNRWFKKIGLNGKAVLPMVLGLGCDTMATMTTRILPSRKERVIVTLLLALGVPCAAQLGVQSAILAGRGPAPLLIWIGVVIGILFTVGWLAAKVLPGQSSDFVLEVPPMRVPRLGNILTKTLARIEWYIKEAVPLFIIGTLLLFAMDKIPIGDESMLVRTEEVGEPLVTGVLGLPQEASSAFVVGFLRRDYGAVWLADAAAAGAVTTNQVLVALVTLTLFIPCVANLLIMIKERGLKTALWMTAFIVPFAFLVGGAVNLTLNLLKITL